MEVGEGRSSSNELSSAPASDGEAHQTWSSHPQRTSDVSTTQHLSPKQSSRAISASGNNGIITNNHQGLSAITSAAVPPNRQEPPPIKQRKPRKKKDDTGPDTDTVKKEKVTRKPRATSSTTASARKKAKIEGVTAQESSQNPTTIPATDLQSSKLVQPITFSPHPPSESRLDEAAKYSQNGLSMHNSVERNHFPNQSPYASKIMTNQPPPAQVSSTTPRSSAIYDPVRSVAISRPMAPTSSSALTPQPVQTPPRPTFRPNDSPTIASIIDPPANTYSGSPSVGLQITSSAAKESPSSTMETVTSKPESSAMDVDLHSTDQNATNGKQTTKKSTFDTIKRGSSPKPTRAKEQLPPIPTGSGLLSSSLFGGDSGVDKNKTTGDKGPNIVIHIDLKDPNNKVISFARLAEEKYGFAALYPRQAAQKERLARVAAAGAALERSASGSKFGGTSAGESGDDDVSVDIDRDSDNDGDVAMSGLNGAQDTANSGTDGPGPKKKRRRKVEEYDQDDPFVDDTELLWEAQAAASKDGFFVYCGPLVPEGEKATVERADGTVKRGRGRGRGGGPGSRGGRAAGASQNTEGGTSRAGGPGSRGGGITRKPRVTKAERLLREQEKAAREKMAPIAAKPSAYPA